MKKKDNLYKVLSKCTGNNIYYSAYDCFVKFFSKRKIEFNTNPEFYARFFSDVLLKDYDDMFNRCFLFALTSLDDKMFEKMVKNMGDKDNFIKFKKKVIDFLYSDYYSYCSFSYLFIKEAVDKFLKNDFFRFMPYLDDLNFIETVFLCDMGYDINKKLDKNEFYNLVVSYSGLDKDSIFYLLNRSPCLSNFSFVKTVKDNGLYFEQDYLKNIVDEFSYFIKVFPFIIKKLDYVSSIISLSGRNIFLNYFYFFKMAVETNPLFMKEIFERKMRLIPVIFAFIHCYYSIVYKTFFGIDIRDKSGKYNKYVIEYFLNSISGNKLFFYDSELDENKLVLLIEFFVNVSEWFRKGCSIKKNVEEFLTFFSSEEDNLLKNLVYSYEASYSY